MKTHIIENGVVVNTIVSSIEDAQAAYPSAICIDAQQHPGAIGWEWDGQKLSEVYPEPVSLAYPRFVGNEKLDLFTLQEQMAVVTATMTDPMVKLMYDRLLGAAYLSYEDPETEQGLPLLVDKGLLTPERKAEIVQQMQPR